MAKMYQTSIRVNFSAILTLTIAVKRVSFSLPASLLVGLLLWCLVNKYIFKMSYFSNHNPLTTNFPQPTSASLSLSDPVLHSDLLDDSLLAEL